MKGYETYLHSPTHQKRTRTAPGGTALVIGLRAASLPDSFGISTPRTGQRHCRAIGLRRPDGAQRHQRLQQDRPCSAQKDVLSPASATHQYPRRSIRAAARSFASEPSRFRYRPKSVDAPIGSAGQLRARIDSRLNDLGFCATGAQAAGDDMETHQTLDHQCAPCRCI